MAPLHGGSRAGKSDLCCGHSLGVVGRPGLHQSGLMSIYSAGCLSPGPRKNDLTTYWALGPFVRSFTLLVDPGDIYPPQYSRYNLVCFYYNYIFIASHKHHISIDVYVLLCIENEEEVVVEEEVAPQVEIPLVENNFYFDICGSDPEAPTKQGKPRCIYPFLVVLNSLSLEMLH
jgi:hypothetical protein